MEYTAQVIAILLVADAPPRWWDDTRSLGYEVRAPV